MARTMSPTHVALYRTVVKTTFVEDSDEKTLEWIDDKYETVPVHKAGDVVTEVFGPYVSNAQNQNYSMIRTGRMEKGDFLDRKDYYWVNDEAWENDYSKRRRDVYVSIANTETHYQILKPVFALQPSGSLTLDLDWVDYDAR